CTGPLAKCSSRFWIRYLRSGATRSNDAALAENARAMNAKAPAVFLMLALCTIGCHSAGSQPAQHPRGYGEGWTVIVDSRTEIEPCRRPPADKSGATSVMLDATADFPCVIRELPVRARLSADVSDDHPSPSHNVVKAPSGGYFSTAQQTTEGRVVQWSATGEFQRSYGHRGDGP